MINKNDFKEISKELNKYDNEREKVIALSREIIRLSKRIIHELHRDNLKSVEPLIKDIKKKIKEIKKYSIFIDIYKTAIQEYVEALTYHSLIKYNKLITKSELAVRAEEYLLGLCDLSGELVRKAVNAAINKKTKESEKIKTFINNLYGEFIKLDIRSGELRKKMDSLRWNLKKLEEVLFDAKKGR